MTISDNEPTEASKKMRVFNARALGGYRALDSYTEDRFIVGEKNREAFEAAKEFDLTKSNIYFFGPTGSGKSHLATIAARKSLPKVAAISQITLSREVRAAEKAYREQEVIERYVSMPVLIIDDLGVGKDTEFSLSLLYEIFQGRYMNMRGGLIVTSNLSLGQMAEKLGDDRISSRLAQMCNVVSLVGEKDHRVNK